jgi:site-specific DNA recombinase
MEENNFNPKIHNVKQGLVLSKDSKSHEILTWNMFVSLAQFYSNNLSEETRKGLDEKANQGWYPGSHKRGYKTVGEMGHKVWIIDEDNIDSVFIPKAFEYFNSGQYTLRTLAVKLFEEGWMGIGNKPIYTSELHKVLTDPFYCGEFLWHKKLYIKARHTPMVSKELFLSVQDRMTRKIKAGKYKKHSFLFGGGIIECAKCGCAVTWENKKGHNYGHCTSFKGGCKGRKYMREEKIQKQILELLDQIRIDNPRLQEWIRKALKESHQSEYDYHEATIKDLDNRINQIDKRLSIIYDDRVDGLITKEQYENKRMQYEMELAELLEAKDKHFKADVDYRKLGMNIFELSQKGREIYETKASMEEKREFLSFVFSNIKLDGEKIVPTFHNGFEVVALRAKTDNVQGWKESNPRHSFWRARSYH